MSKSKLNLILQLVVQVLAQGAVIQLVPENLKPVIMAIVAIVGVIISFLDTSVADQQKLTGKKF